MIPMEGDAVALELPQNGANRQIRLRVKFREGFDCVTIQANQSVRDLIGVIGSRFQIDP